VCGCSDLEVLYDQQIAKIRTPGKEIPTIIRAGDWVSINGDTGEILVGKQSLSPANFKGSTTISRFMDLVDSKKKMRVLANADTPADASEARRNGAEGIGLTRTEHMFFAEDRINVVRRMILAKDAETRRKALAELIVYQRKDFEGILEAMDGLPVTVRLLGDTFSYYTLLSLISLTPLPRRPPSA
jgi:pyruvate,orthophosphate dikinase